MIINIHYFTYNIFSKSHEEIGNLSLLYFLTLFQNTIVLYRDVMENKSALAVKDETSFKWHPFLAWQERAISKIFSITGFTT